MTSENNRKGLGSHEHNWPAHGGHMFGDWLAFSNELGKPPRQYRTCVHPKCNHAEYRNAPMG